MKKRTYNDRYKELLEDLKKEFPSKYEELMVKTSAVYVLSKDLRLVEKFIETIKKYKEAPEIADEIALIITTGGWMMKRYQDFNLSSEEVIDFLCKIYSQESIIRYIMRYRYEFRKAKQIALDVAEKMLNSYALLRHNKIFN